MAFSFGFSGDDIDIDIDIDESENDNGVPDMLVPQSTGNSLPELVKPSKHDMDEWVSSICKAIQCCPNHRTVTLMNDSSRFSHHKYHSTGSQSVAHRLSLRAGRYLTYALS